MAQVTLYLDDLAARGLRAAAEAEGISQSQWVARLIRDRLATRWPESVVALAGAWRDMPTAEELRRDTPAESLREDL